MITPASITKCSEAYAKPVLMRGRDSMQPSWALAYWRRMERRTRSGNIVGSYKAPLDDYAYWSERSWDTNEPGFVVVAPSGARLKWVKTEDEARMEVKRRQREERLARLPQLPSATAGLTEEASLSHNRFRYPRRGAHPPGFDESCVVMRPPNQSDVMIGVCGDLELWRVRVYDFDRYGSESAELREAIADAANSVRDRDPDLAAKLDAIAVADD